VEREAAPRSDVQVIVSGISVNILNPKLSIFLFAFLPQFVRSGEPDAFARMLELSGAFMAANVIVFAAYGVFAAAVRSHVISRPRVLAWMRRIFAAAFVALGAKLAFADR